MNTGHKLKIILNLSIHSDSKDNILVKTNLWQGNGFIAESDNDKHWQSYIYEPDSHRPLAL
ncbi:hypothetical protein GA0061080_105627 [Gilliamella intestini]|uniref:Uncharacterized protein n=1 Tax=Gilliamella intestini TaxID=1798183 RepID=A0A1C4D2F9_9GAMM|nr:hypothetical protein GA0061080_105627 [Gilliamella intestini]